MPPCKFFAQLSLLILGAMLAYAPEVRAGDIYMGTDENGVLTFTDTPRKGCTGNFHQFRLVSKCRFIHPLQLIPTPQGQMR